MSKFENFLIETQLLFASWGIFGILSMYFFNIAKGESESYFELADEVFSNYNNMGTVLRECRIDDLDCLRHHIDIFNQASYSAFLIFIIISFVIIRKWFRAFTEINEKKTIDNWLYVFFIISYIFIVFAIIRYIISIFLNVIHYPIFWIIGSLLPYIAILFIFWKINEKEIKFWVKNKLKILNEKTK